MVFENVELDRPSQFWHDYKVVSDAGGPDIPTHAIEAAKEFAKLSLIHLDNIIAWCGSAGKIGTKDILDIYGRYLAWRDGLSAALAGQIENLDDETTLPFVLLL